MEQERSILLVAPSTNFVYGKSISSTSLLAALKGLECFSPSARSTEVELR